MTFVAAVAATIARASGMPFAAAALSPIPALSM